MATSFSDWCVRYGQEYVYTRFSEGNMTLGEIYMTLAYGPIDPICLPLMAIIHYDDKVWCTDTRRLTLAKELERQGRFDILEIMHVKEVKQNTSQYKDFVHHRLPAMQRKGLDGLNIKVSDQRGPTCCFNKSDRFRIDLKEHIIRDHLANFTLELFKNLTTYYCNICKTTTRITCTKSSDRRYYTIIRKCSCKPKKAHRFPHPRSQLMFAELCTELLRYNHSVKQKVNVQKPPSQPNNISKIYCETSTQTETPHIDHKPAINTPDSPSHKTTKNIVSPQLIASDSKLQFNTLLMHTKLIDYTQNQSNLHSFITDHTLKQKKPGITSAPRQTYQTTADIKTINTYKNSDKHPRRHNKTKIRAPKSCCNISYNVL